MHCAMTGRPLQDISDGIYDDGEWISWDWINSQIEEQALKRDYPAVDPHLVRIFDGIVAEATAYKQATGRYLQLWGELGEFYAEIRHGLVRHPPGTQGSDGRIGNDWIEVKTISPEKIGEIVEVKLAGNFNKLLLVRIDEDFKFSSCIIDRKALGKNKGKHARVRWGRHQFEAQPDSEI